MKKIKTIFERNWDGDRRVIDKYVNEKYFDVSFLRSAIATEKLDGTNIRLTLRSGIVVRIEKRRNPDKFLKAKGIEEPWYVDVDAFAPEDKYIREAVETRTFNGIPDGEWSGEVVGKNVQGNPLKLDKNTVVLFSCGEAPVFNDVPTTFQELKDWLPKQKSKFGNDCGIEGIVWHCKNGDMYKIKVKDF